MGTGPERRSARIYDIGLEKSEKDRLSKIDLEESDDPLTTFAIQIIGQNAGKFDLSSKESIKCLKTVRDFTDAEVAKVLQTAKNDLKSGISLAVIACAEEYLQRRR